VRLLDWPEAAALLQDWGYTAHGGWPPGVATESFSAHQEPVMPSAIPHRQTLADPRLLAEAAPEFAKASPAPQWLALRGRCGQTHHVEDSEPIDPAASWPILPAGVLQLPHPFRGGVLLDREDLDSSLRALAYAALGAQTDVVALAADGRLMMGFCHDGDLHLESSDLDLLRELRARALELGLFANPPDDWP
jgi:hypothetical protein